LVREDLSLDIPSSCYVYRGPILFRQTLKPTERGMPMTRVLGIYGSPRRGGNSDQLLDKALEGAGASGAETRAIYARDLNMSGCIECGGCDKTGKCVVKDDMQSIYPLLEEAHAIILATPIFFYSVTAQAKALIDRSQASWSKRMLEKTPDQRRQYDRGKGYLIAVAASKGEKLFDCVQLTTKYFFDALDMSYEGGLFFRRLEKSYDVRKRPETLEEAFRLGARAAHPIAA
jgi:multimeric flavodoxin WrbA